VHRPEFGGNDKENAMLDAGMPRLSVCEALARNAAPGAVCALVSR